MIPQAVMIFAAGRGTRMGALTAARPKPLIEVSGRPLIDHALDLARAVAPSRLVVNTHYLGAQIRDHLAGQDVMVSDEADLLRETGGGLRHALPLLGPGPVFTLNSDALWRGDNPLRRLAAAWDPARMEALLLMLPRDAALGHSGAGDFRLTPEGRLTRGPELVYSGAQILRTEGLASIREEVFSLNLLWDRIAARGGLYGLAYDGLWCDVGRPENLPLAESLIAEGTRGAGDVS
ncbi:MAG: nucleotidyltransferase family protein [Rhodobacterales bacterium]|nr:nucleotidyltransferase family protein [Rhodobacterales bacterium]NCT13298.1 nucleotidyltransferase family protein [Rhodobacterales bacterium]